MTAIEILKKILPEVQAPDAKPDENFPRNGIIRWSFYREPRHWICRAEVIVDVLQPTGIKLDAADAPNQKWLTITRAFRDAAIEIELSFMVDNMRAAIRAAMEQ